MKRIVVVLIVSLAGVAAFACNGGDGGGAPTSSPASTATPAGTSTPSSSASATSSTVVSGAGEIAYFGPDGADIWLIDADGSGQRKLTEGQCQQAAGPFWSRGGDKIACASGGTSDAPQAKIAVFDLDGKTLAQVEQQAFLRSFAWSADGHHFVYAIAEGEALDTARPTLVIGDTDSEAAVRLEDAQDPRWSPDGTQLAYMKTAGEELTIYDLASGQANALPQGLHPVAWALGGKALLVAAGYKQQDVGFEYEASLLDVASGEMTRVAELDNGTQFWLTRDGQKAAFAAGKAERTEGGVTISILDLATHTVTPIEGAVVGYPSEAIPGDHIAFSADGAFAYWIDVVASDQDISGAIYRARSDGSQPIQMAVLSGILFNLSPDRTKVLYYDGSALSVASVDGSDARSLVQGVGGRWPPAVWQPLP